MRGERRRRFRRTPPAPAALLVALVAGVVSGSAAMTAAAEDPREAIRALFEDRRHEAGLEPLRTDARLDAAATAIAEGLAAAAESYPTTRPERLVRFEAERERLSEHLKASGYESHSARAVMVIGDVSAESALASMLADEGTALYRGLFDEDARDLGVGVARVGEERLCALIFALSAKDDFALRTAPLADLEAVRDELVEELNRARAAQGREPLVPDRCLDEVAQDYARRMLEEGFYAHLDPEGAGAADRVGEGGCRFRGVAENLASGIETPGSAIAGWLSSPDHRGPMLDKSFERVGFGRAYGEGPGGRRILWVQLMGHR